MWKARSSRRAIMRSTVRRETSRALAARAGLTERQETGGIVDCGTIRHII